jgi:hypothetical protein
MVRLHLGRKEDAAASRPLWQERRRGGKPHALAKEDAAASRTLWQERRPGGKPHAASRDLI